MADLILVVHVRPRSRRTDLYRDAQGRIVAAVPEAPEKGRANRAVQRLISTRLGVPRSAVHLVGGRTSRTKRFRIEGLDRSDLDRLLPPPSEGGS